MIKQNHIFPFFFFKHSYHLWNISMSSSSSIEKHCFYKIIFEKIILEKLNEMSCINFDDNKYKYYF